MSPSAREKPLELIEGRATGTGSYVRVNHTVAVSFNAAEHGNGRVDQRVIHRDHRPHAGEQRAHKVVLGMRRSLRYDGDTASYLRG